MRQKLELKDDLGNHGILEFEIPATDNQIMKTMKSREIILVAMEFSRMVGTLETLGNVSQNCFHIHKLDLLHWAEEYVRSNEEDVVLFFANKLDELH